MGDKIEVSNEQKKYVTEILVKVKWGSINDLEILLEKKLAIT